MRLWPRLPLPRARARAAQFDCRPIEELRESANATTASQLFAPTGGARVDTGELRRLKQDLEFAACGAGFPEVNSRKAKSAFDFSVLTLLADYGIPFGEAIRPEMWAWITVELVPHLVSWRWADKSGAVKPERFAGQLVRNALGRLWYQGNRLDRGAKHPERWLFSDRFTSDQAVALLERPSLAGNRELCLAVGRRWAELPAAARDEELFRDAMKLLIVRAGVVRLDVLGEDSLYDLVSESFTILMGDNRIGGSAGAATTSPSVPAARQG